MVPVACLLWLAGCGKDTQALRNEYLEKGNRLTEARKYRDASLNYRKALQFDPNSGEAFYRLGLSELKQDSPAAAFPALYRATLLLPNDDRPRIEFANLCLSRYLSDSRRPAELREHLERMGRQLAERNPESYDALRLQGYVAMFGGNSREALVLFEKANRQRPHQAEVSLAMGECLLREGRAEESERLALELIQEQPHYGPIYDFLYTHYRTRQRVADAEKILEKKAENNPGEPAYLLEIAAHYAGLPNDLQMNRALQALLAQSRRLPTARLLVGDFYVKLGRLPDATEQYRKGVEAGGADKLTYQKRLVEALMAASNTAEADRVVRETLRDHPEDADVLAKRALVALGSGKRERVEWAIGELSQLAATQPNDANLPYHLGRGYLALGRLAEARTQFLEALRRRSDSIPVRLGLAEVALRGQQHKDAIQYADQVLAVEPRHSRARLLRASGLVGLGDYETARKELTQLLADQPDSPEAQLQLGAIYIAQKKYAQAEEAFRVSKEKIRDDLRPIEGLVETFAFQNRFDKAYAVLQENLAGAPNSVRLRLMLAETAAHAGNFDLAIEQHRQILKLNPRYSDSYFDLAEIALQRGDIPSAIQDLEQARSIAPRDAKVVGLLAFAQEKAGHLEDAKIAYRQCLGLQAENPAIQNNLAYLIAETGGDLGEAQRLAERALRGAPQNASYVDTLGWVYLKRNMTESALKIFRQLIASYPEEPTIRYHLAMSLLQSGDRAQAKVELKRVLERNPPVTFEVKIREAIARLS